MDTSSLAGSLDWTRSGNILLDDIKIYIERSGGNEILAAMMIIESKDFFEIDEVIQAKRLIKKHHLYYSNVMKVWLHDGRGRFLKKHKNWTPEEEIKLLRVYRTYSNQDMEITFKRSIGSIVKHYHKIIKLGTIIHYDFKQVGISA